MNEVLEALGIHVSKLKKTKQEIKLKAMKETKFHGRDCNRVLLQKKADKRGDMMLGFELIIEAMQYEAGGYMNKAVALELWHALEALITELSDQKWDADWECLDWPSLTAAQKAERESRAAKLEGLAKAYLDLYVKHIGADYVTLYMHVCCMHAGQMVRRVGSLSRWSMQALEHSHSLRKKDQRLACNFAVTGRLTRKRRDGTQATIKICHFNTQLTRESMRFGAKASLPERTAQTNLGHAGRAKRRQEKDKK